MAAPVPEVFEHTGQWTEAEYLALPVDRRVELLGGALLVSPGDAAADRAVKPQLYAQAGIPHYLRIELGTTGPCAVVYQLEHDHYVAVARGAPDHPLVLTEPIAITLNLAALATATRPSI